MSSRSHSRNAIVSSTSACGKVVDAPRVMSMAARARSRIDPKSRTAFPTSPSTSRTASASSPSRSLGRWWSSSRWMNDSRAVASVAGRIRSIPPAALRSTPITGCSARRVPSPRLWISCETESNRNGESWVFVSTTLPAER